MGDLRTYASPLSPSLRIPSHCPICGQVQYDGVKARDSEAPYGDGSGIEDLCLDINRSLRGLWTVCHVVCKAWFRDETVSRLGILWGKIDTDDGDHDDEFDKVHEAIRQSISSDHGEDVLIAMLGPGFHIPNPTAAALGGPDTR